MDGRSVWIVNEDAQSGSNYGQFLSAYYPTKIFRSVADALREFDGGKRPDVVLADLRIQNDSRIWKLRSGDGEIPPLLVTGASSRAGPGDANELEILLTRIEETFRLRNETALLSSIVELQALELTLRRRLNASYELRFRRAERALENLREIFPEPSARVEYPQSRRRENRFRRELRRLEAQVEALRLSGRERGRERDPDQRSG